MTIVRKFILPLMLCFLFSGCGDTIKGKSIAEPQVAAFHEKLNSKQFEEIFSSASDEFRAAAPKEKVLALFAAIERKLGKVKSSSIKSWNSRTFNFTTTVVLIAETEFEQGAATETFTFTIGDSKAILTGYIINSIDMLIR